MGYLSWILKFTKSFGPEYPCWGVEVALEGETLGIPVSEYLLVPLSLGYSQSGLD